MKTIYVLTEGCYSDYGVVAVTSDLATAQKMEKLGHGSIEEFPFLESEEELVSIPYYNVRLHLDGRPIITRMERYTNWQTGPTSGMFTSYGPGGVVTKFPVGGISMWSTKSYDHALKSARDILAVFKNEFGDRDDFPMGFIHDWFHQVATKEVD